MRGLDRQSVGRHFEAADYGVGRLAGWLLMLLVGREFVRSKRADREIRRGLAARLGGAQDGRFVWW